ncbi:hypothetical protein [uncultured Roseovarius sp.]|uniref:hypothetical protein n=1 Tax=uncultured Roseovarius sp. TaxID=293344 RepID=UPI00260D7A77|nr:hypothetical protein [uncultured Roseovarius sp.]
MKKRLFLHVGMPKCATTSIQAYLADHANELAARGIHYEFAPGERIPEQGNALHLANAMLEGDTARVKSLLDFFLRRDGDVILSSEYLFGVARGSIALEVVERMRQAGFEVGVICYFRRQDLWIESDYKQHVKSGADWRRGITALMEMRVEKQVLNYNAMLMNWVRSVARENILAVPLRPEQAPDYAVRRFLEALGISDLLPDDAVSPRSHNVSPPTGLIEPARYLKRAMLDQGVAPLLVGQEVDRFFAKAPAVVRVPSRRFLMTFLRRQRLLQQCEMSNAALARNFLNGDAAFDMTPDYDEASETPLGAEAAVILAAYHVRGQTALHSRSRLRQGLGALKRTVSRPRVRN